MDTLVRHYEQPIYHAAYRLLGNAEDAADVTQSTFLQAFGNLRQYNPAFRFFSWVYRIAINEALDLQSRAARTRPHEPAGLEALPDDAPGPDASVTARESNDELGRALLALGLEDRTVLVLHYFAGCSYLQMAAILEISEKTVKSRLFTARQRLKSELERRGVVGS